MNQLSERYLEDFAVGQTFRSGRLLDEAAARRSIFLVGLTASGWHTTAAVGVVSAVHFTPRRTWP
jgi:acyl dehydratase